MITKDAHDLGVVVITFEGDSIVPFHFAHPWPHSRFIPDRHLLDARSRLSTVDGDDGQRVQISKIVRATVDELLGPGSQQKRPLIESEYYAAPLRYREPSFLTGCGKISADGAIYCKRIRLALTHSGWAARDKLAASTSTY